MSLSLLLTEYYSSLPRVVAASRASGRQVLHAALPGGRSQTFVVPDSAYLNISPGDGQGLLSLIVWERLPDADGSCGAILYTAALDEQDAQTRLALGW